LFSRPYRFQKPLAGDLLLLGGDEIPSRPPDDLLGIVAEQPAFGHIDSLDDAVAANLVIGQWSLVEQLAKPLFALHEALLSGARPAPRAGGRRRRRRPPLPAPRGGRRPPPAPRGGARAGRGPPPGARPPPPPPPPPPPSRWVKTPSRRRPPIGPISMQIRATR